MEIIDCRLEKGVSRLKGLKETALYNEEVEQSVSEILQKVRVLGDKALIEYTQVFDSYSLCPSMIEVGKDAINVSRASISKKLADSIEYAKKNIEEYAKKLLRKSWSYKRRDGSVLGEEIRPVEKVGIYVPGGTAPLVSTVLMTAVIARVAGVKEIFVASPPCTGGDISLGILAACSIAGVDSVFRVGGAQAIGAFAFGTKTVPKVDKIVGPGNVYVSCAKRQVYGFVDIDMVAGPSEVLIIADKTSNPKFIAADMLAQAEHDTASRIYLVSVDKDLIVNIEKEIYRQSTMLSRKKIISESLSRGAFLVVVRDLTQAINVANIIAPEHIEVMVENPEFVVRRINNAGAIFVGEWTPEAIGDFVAGPSHVLPTSGGARWFSGLSVSDFLKRISLINYSEEAFKKASKYAVELSDIEKLDGHGNSVKIRMKKNSIY
ncbi:MAG: histidinol dehydrogenase [Candidatus Aureabacteria bacterium]|nr:histidinol dehydrogenase [Candidatus Auribacterota bacterium]